jgi:hypothetical protein
MKIVVKKNMTFQGKHYRAGTILDIPPSQYDMITMFYRGGVELLTEPAVSSVRAYEELEAYLDEKGVEYLLGATSKTGPTISDTVVLPLSPYEIVSSCTLIVYNVYPKFFHEVVVPSIREICKRRGIIMRARNYEKLKGMRTLELQLRYESDVIRGVDTKHLWMP